MADVGASQVCKQHPEPPQGYVREGMSSYTTCMTLQACTSWEGSFRRRQASVGCTVYLGRKNKSQMC